MIARGVVDGEGCDGKCVAVRSISRIAEGSLQLPSTSLPGCEGWGSPWSVSRPRGSPPEDSQVEEGVESGCTEQLPMLLMQLKKVCPTRKEVDGFVHADLEPR